MEMRMVISAMVQRFDMAFAEGFDQDGWLGTLEDHFISTRGPLMVKLTARPE